MVAILSFMPSQDDKMSATTEKIRRLCEVLRSETMICWEDAGATTAGNDLPARWSATVSDTGYVGYAATFEDAVEALWNEVARFHHELNSAREEAPRPVAGVYDFGVEVSGIALAARLDALDLHIAEGTLIRQAWTSEDPSGRRRACLLAALSPEAGEAQEAALCPAAVMPAWLAHLTPWMDDSGSLDAWPAMVRRYAALARRWHVLSPAQWYRLDYVARAIAVRAAMDSTTNVDVLAVCRQTAALCDRRGAGEEVTDQEFTAAAWRAAAAAEAEADRITDAILGAIERECSVAEVRGQ